MNIFYKSSLALVLVATGLTSCSNEEIPATMDAGQSVHMTVTVSRENMGQTRTEFSENNGNLDCRWNKDDILIVTDENGINKGNLTVKELKDGGVNAVFDGEIKGIVGNKAKLNYYYIGTKAEYKTDENRVYTADYSVQDGNFTSLPEKDLLSATAEIVISGGQSFVDNMELSRRISFAHFNLQFADGTTLSSNATVTVSGEGLNNAISIDTKNREASYTAGSVTITPAVADLYMVLLPSTKGFDLTFTVTDGDKTYNGTCKVNNPIGEGKYYRKALTDGTFAGLPVEMIKNEEQPNNPGNTGSWGGEDLPPAWHRENISLISKADGWTLNVSTKFAESYGGFGYYVGYDHNGIVNGMLTSKNNNRIDSSAIFYQWGRWLGFPWCANWIYLIPTGDGEIYSPDGNIYTEMLPLGVNYGEIKIGYSWWNSGSGAYVSAYMGANDTWTKKRAIDCSICYGLGNKLTHMDYVFDNEVCTWEERGGNPAPDGYAVPTVAQLKALIPNDGQIVSNSVQYKTIEGIRYAMKWSIFIDSEGELPGVEIRSFATTETNVTASDSRFASANPVKLITYGYLSQEGDLMNEGSRGYFWSCESGVNDIDGTKGNGGKALYVYVNGNTIQMGIKVLPRTFAANVYLIKCENKKSDSIKPWFPLTGVGTPHW